MNTASPPFPSTSSVIVRSPNQVSTNLGKEIVILGLPSEQYYSLKKVGAYIWTLIETPVSVQAVIDAVAQKYAVDAARCQTDVLALVQDLINEGLIEVQ